MEKKSLIILSGGLDSVTALYQYADEIALAVSFNYGSNNNKKELEFAEYHCKKLGIERICIELNFIKNYFTSSLLTGSESVPVGHYDDEKKMKSTVLPFRNGIMLAIAAGIADCRKLKKIIIGSHAGDPAFYKDVCPEFFKKMSQAINSGTCENIEIVTPFINIKKTDIIKIGLTLGVEYEKTWSCYKGKEKQCGECAPCTERREAFELAGVKDPTEYESEKKYY